MQVPAPQGYLYYSAVSKPNLGGPSNSLFVNLRLIREGGHEQLISNVERFKPFNFLLGGLQCVGHSFDYVDHFVFLGDVWI
jgi:hypothetical protein